MNLPEFGVRRPVTNLMIFSSIILLAFYSLTRLGIDMLPEIEPPAISVISTYPGASSEDVEIKVTEPLENQLSTTPGLEKLTSKSSEGFSLITLKFKWGVNLDEASNDIRDRIELAKRFLPNIPSEMENPFIFKFNTANIPIIYLGITANETYPELFDLIDKRVGDALRQIPGVGTVQLVGGLERQINIWVDRGRLEGYGFSILDINNALKRQNITQPVGSIKSGLTDYLLRLPGEFATPDEINLVILGSRNGKYVYLRDVARVEDSFKEVIMNVRIDRRPGILMFIQKQTGTNTVEVARSIKRKLAELEKILPKDVRIFTIFDSSKDIINSLNSLKSAVWISIGLIIFVVWFFLRQFLPSLIVALTIPFSILIAFVYLFLSGKTINTISLSSLAIAAGMVVDNAIVVVDNAYRHLERGQRPQEAAIFGTSEMFLAIAASTLTTVVVFMPLLFVSGVVGIMFGELAMIVIVTLTASLFTAATFTPMLCSRWLKVRPSIKSGGGGSRYFNKFYEISERWFSSMENAYSNSLAWSLKHKKSVIYGFLGAFVLSLFLMKFVGNEFIPEEDTGDIRITAEMPLGTRVEESDKIARKIEDIFKKEIPETKYLFSRSGESSGIGRAMGGTSGSHIVVAGAKLVPKDQRKRSVRHVAAIVRSEIHKIPGIMKLDISTGNPISRLVAGGTGKSIEIDIIGHSFEDTDKLAKKIKGVVEKVPGAVDVSISREINRPEIRIDVDREKAAVLGIDMSTIADSAKTFVEGSTATKYREKGETYDIYVRLEEPYRSEPEDISNLPLTAPLPENINSFRPLQDLEGFKGINRKQIKLGNIARVYETAGPVEIERQNRERIVKVECNTYKRSPGKVREDIQKELRKITIPSDISISFGGEAEEQSKAFGDLVLLLILGIFLVYMVMAAQFESLVDPFIVMFSVPFTFTGVILAFVLTRTTLSVMTFLALVMLMGIVVNNAIVLVSYINILRSRGFSMIDAVTKGGKDRLRPILMTTVTTLAGLLPLALSRGEGSEVWQPLGITMLGGLCVSTLVTLLFIPTLYSIAEARVKIGRKKK